MRKKIWIALVFFMTLGLSINATTYASNTERNKLEKIKKENDKLTQQLNQNKKEAKKHQEELAKLDKDIDSADKQLQKVENDLTGIEKKINASKVELQKATENYKDREGLYKKRIKAMYKNGTVGYLNVILASKDFGDFLGRIYTVQKIAEKDKELMAEIQEEQNTIATRKEKLEAEVVLLANAKHSVESKKSDLVVATRNKEVRIKEIQKSNGELEKQIDQNNKESQELAKIIQSRQVKTAYIGGEMLWPVKGYYKISSPYGNRIHPILKKMKFHSGIDIQAPTGANILAANDGEVIFAGWKSGYGNFIIVDHGGKTATAYAHCSRIVARDGQKVKKGDVIAKVGTTGYSTGPHLHFEVRVNGNTIDPTSKLK